MRHSARQPGADEGGLACRRVVVEVPATSANLGAGYDALALALELKLRVTVELLDRPGLELSVEGEGGALISATSENRFNVALEKGLRRALGSLPPGLGWRVAMHNQIPLARGLGSSAAAAVAGLVAANAFASNALSAGTQLALATEIEGHPDNAAAALLGGLAVVAMSDGLPHALRIEPPAGLRCVLFVPLLPLETGAMRAALPSHVPLHDAAFNIGRAALTVAAFAANRPDLLRASTEDRLHQPYRAGLYPQLPALLAAAREAGALGAFLSGAGSSVLAFADTPGAIAEVAAALEHAAGRERLAGSALVVAPRAAGAVVIETA